MERCDSSEIDICVSFDVHDESVTTSLRCIVFSSSNANEYLSCASSMIAKQSKVAIESVGKFFSPTTLLSLFFSVSESNHFKSNTFDLDLFAD